jgi:hypothetical protein
MPDSVSYEASAHDTSPIFGRMRRECRGAGKQRLYIHDVFSQKLGMYHVNQAIHTMAWSLAGGTVVGVPGSIVWLTEPETMYLPLGDQASVLTRLGC